MARIIDYLNLVKIEHTVFALPFAYSGMILAYGGVPQIKVVLLVTLAMVTARTAAMAFNRYLDAEIDAANPRTAAREIPRGVVSKRGAILLVVFSSIFFFITAYFINTLAFILSPIALSLILFYSYTKRFTAFSHLFLGLSLAAAPLGGWIAVVESVSISIIVVAVAVGLWVFGFDIIYSLQDVEFDKQYGLFSIPAVFGVQKALMMAFVSHISMVCLLYLFPFFYRKIDLGYIYYFGVTAIAVFLVVEHLFARNLDVGKINTAFFTFNAFVSIIFLLIISLEVVV